MIVQHGDKMYSPVAIGPWADLVPVDVHKQAELTRRWHGKKIPLGKWRAILGFFEWSYDLTGGETLVHLFYHDAHGWEPMVLPQKAYRGMTISKIEDHPGHQEAMAKLPGAWVPGTPWKEEYDHAWAWMGTVHHHCSSSAFQSSTDLSDEKDKEGLHITIGKVGSAEYDLHARSSLRGRLMGVTLADWFELEEYQSALVPPKLHPQLLECMLVASAKGETFPEFWKENVIKVEYAPQQPCIGYSGYPQSSYSGGRGMYQDTSYYNRRQLPAHYQQHNGAVSYADFGKELKSIAAAYGMTLEAMRAAIEEMQHAPYRDIIEAMTDYDEDPRSALWGIAELIDEERLEAAIKSLPNEELPKGTLPIG